MTGAIIKKPKVTCIDGRDLVLGTGENKFRPANRLDFPDEFVVRSDPRLLITGYARGNVIAHGRKSPFDRPRQYNPRRAWSRHRTLRR